MKKNCLSILALMVVVGGAMAQDSYTITGNFPGLKAGAKVELVNRDIRDRNGESWYKVDGEVTKAGEFVINGSVDMPTLCEIRIIPVADAQGDEVKDKAFTLMVDNMPMSVSAAHIDSVPLSFSIGPAELYKNKNVTVKGGEAQREYEEYQAYLLPYEAAGKQAHYNLYWDEARDKSKDGKARLKDAYNAAEKALREAGDRFVEEHPAYHISLMRIWQNLSDPFVYSNDELDAIWTKVSANDSPVRKAKIKEAIDKARRFVRGQQYSDFTALDPEGMERKFSDVVGTGRYTMVDFWASWCGPCRMAIPHVRELHEKYGDRLGVIAVSVDEDPDAWKVAMDQEKMDWAQLRVSKENFNALTKAYNFNSIPFMVLMNGEGRIVFAGHDPVKVASILEKNL